MSNRGVVLGAFGLHDNFIIMVEAEPFQAVKNSLNCLVGRALAVGILNAKQEFPIVVARIEPIKQRRSGAADVKISGWGGGKTSDNSRFQYQLFVIIELFYFEDILNCENADVTQPKSFPDYALDLA